MNDTSEVKRHMTIERAGERGGARLKFLITIVVLALVGYSASQYVPVAIHAYQYKDMMQQTVDRAAFGQSSDWVIGQLRASASEYDVPPDAVITAMQQDGRMAARVQFVRPISFPGYVYKYNFDQTVKSGQFLTVK
ncbi:MAG: hypothetical protein ABR577_15965 [Pyrinomonadaceae bacterium]